MATTTAEPVARTMDDNLIQEQKRLALAHISEAWDGALADGVESDILAHAALFFAISDLIAAYGEEAVAGLAKSLPGRIRNFEFSLERRVQ